MLKIELTLGEGYRVKPLRHPFPYFDLIGGFAQEFHNMSDSIFEIREYLDSEGKVNSHDVTDISKELEYMEKLVNSMQAQPSALNDEDQFIRDLALLSQENSFFDEDQLDDDFFSTIEAREAQGPVQKAPVVVKKVSGEKQKSGWGKGFLSSKPATKAAKPAANSVSGSTSTSTNNGSGASTDSVIAAAEKMSISDSNSNTSVSENQAKTVHVTLDKSPAALKGILKHTTPVTNTTTTNSTTPTTSATNTSTTATTNTSTTNTSNTTTEPANSAFSGNIMERAPTKTVAKLGTGSKGVILGGLRKNV